MGGCLRITGVSTHVYIYIYICIDILHVYIHRQIFICEQVQRLCMFVSAWFTRVYSLHKSSSCKINGSVN